jgi:hypothetical protein
MFENVFLTHWRHLWAFTFPFSFYIYNSSNVTISKFLLFNITSLFFFISNRTCRLSITLTLGIFLDIFTLFKRILTKEQILNQSSSGCKCFHVRPGYLHIDHVNQLLTKNTPDH